MMLQMTISIGDILEVIGLFGGLVVFLLRQSRLHAQNQVRIAVMETKIENMDRSLTSISDTLKTIAQRRMD